MKVQYRWLAGALALALVAMPVWAEIKVGMVAPFSGAASSLGDGMKRGIEARFAEVNEAGGVHGESLTLVTRDDGYEPLRSAKATRELLDDDEVLAMLGNVGTPTAIVNLPILLEHEMPLIGALTGSGVLRQSPPDRYVFNYRASYAQETATMIEGLLLAGIEPDEIAFFTQADGYGDAGYRGALRALANHGYSHPERLAHGRYTRGTRNIHRGLATVLQAPVTPKAVIIVGTYGPAADFIREARKDLPDALFLNVSFVGSQALLDALGNAAEGVIVTQVVPPHTSDLPGVEAYRAALEAKGAGSDGDFVSLEGYMAASLFVEGLQAAGADADREALVDALEGLGKVDLGIGRSLTLGPEDHQASDAVWTTRIDDGQFVPVDWFTLLEDDAAKE
ncbi:amino acid/amide ABC transporter substrate-binding protein (HAAT family) [Chromohalobacter marismortui]|uniref:Amino acid/amide ABC transporter substrate-binding protein (HAAT family) n=1 Tax=Chromohalobacter marismortui TaxID=42055 RepID=A0A4R7NWH5_9GAMM|nr:MULTISPECIES: ABC transporter substrate-binding protein [Chromohalobacter]MCI0511157.1 ABC transporter substrate-binding protein [Chromohalobacter sp.]MCI0593607.1 ABC transporter substrate-binding protein [Chromohalobacter sp.]TDU25182.1 amino acid/amide ABC transporter substrate-binding protein (HAAT family) [Chromohalobacter marismortui]